MLWNKGRDRTKQVKFSLILGSMLMGLCLPGLTANSVYAQSDGIEVKTDRATCLELARHPAVPSADYVPGVDAYGRKVAPAEGAGGNDYQWLTESITVVLSVDMAKRYGLGDDGTAFQADAPLGQVKLKNGRVMVNGRPLLTSDEASVREACRQMGVPVR